MTNPITETNTEGLQIYVVGGAVREILLGQTPKDMDFLVLHSTPEEMIERGFKGVGAAFPVFLDKVGNEYALARTERKSGTGYNGFVCDFSKEVTLEEDILRRDLTINALVVAQSDWNMFVGSKDLKYVIDYHNGVADLKIGILRHISDAFNEDPVRVLRVARFAARYNFTVAPETIELMQQMVVDGELNFLTPERVWKELSQALPEGHPERFFEVLHECYALPVVLPELYECWTPDTTSVLNGMSNASLEEGFCCLVMTLDKPEEAGLFEKLKAPSDLIDLAKLCRNYKKFVTFFGYENGENKCDDFPEQLVDFTYEVDIYRKFLRFNKALNVFNTYDQILHGIDMVDMMSCLNLCHALIQIKAETVLKQNPDCKGKTIGEALKKERVVAIKWLLSDNTEAVV